MTLVYRLLRQPFAATPFDGEGSYRFGGRWSHAGTRMVYTAEHLSLAMVDYLAHLDPDRPTTDFVLAKADVPDDVNRVLLTADDLPPDWRRYPEPQILADLGSDFVKQEKAAIMIVPSALATVENNWLLNPVHQDFRRIRILDTESFQYGPRLLRI